MIKYTQEVYTHTRFTMFNYYKQYNLKLRRDRYITSLPTGLRSSSSNVEASILQCLFHTFNLTDYILSVKQSKLAITDKTFISLLIQTFDLILDNKHSINLDRFLKVFRSNQSSNTPNTPSTLSESVQVLDDLLQLIHKSIQFPVNIEITGGILNNSDKLMKESYEMYREKHGSDYSFIIENFYGTTVSGTASSGYTFDTFSRLNVPLHTDNLYENLDMHFHSSSLWNLPNHLIITLPLVTLGSSKVIIIEDLDLTKYISKDKQDPNTYIYKLYAINCKSGSISTWDSKNYSVCKSWNGKWYVFDGANIIETDIHSSVISNCAHILFYHKLFVS